MAIPPNPPGDIFDEEAAAIERRRKRIEELENKIVEIENGMGTMMGEDPNDSRLEELAELRKELRKLRKTDW